MKFNSSVFQRSREMKRHHRNKAQHKRSSSNSSASSSSGDEGQAVGVSTPSGFSYAKAVASTEVIMPTNKPSRNGIKREKERAKERERELAKQLDHFPHPGLPLPGTTTPPEVRKHNHLAQRLGNPNRTMVPQHIDRSSPLVTLGKVRPAYTRNGVEMGGIPMTDPYPKYRLDPRVHSVPGSTPVPAADLGEKLSKLTRSESVDSLPSLIDGDTTSTPEGHTDDQDTTTTDLERINDEKDTSLGQPHDSAHGSKDESLAVSKECVAEPAAVETPAQIGIPIPALTTSMAEEDAAFYAYITQHPGNGLLFSQLFTYGDGIWQEAFAYEFRGMLRVIYGAQIYAPHLNNFNVIGYDALPPMPAAHLY